MRTGFAAVALVALSFGRGSNAAGEARSVGSVTAPPAIVLGSTNEAPFRLCPSGTSSREQCRRASQTVNSALGAIRRQAHRPGVERVVLFLAGYSTTYGYGESTAIKLQAAFGPRTDVMYVDWGTHGRKIEYEADALRARNAVAPFVAFLVALHRTMPDRPIDIFAHSMGCRVATGAMDKIAAPRDGHPYIAETVLAAPDVRFADYQHAITRNPRPFGRVTIYVSRYDRALGLSAFIHLHRRLGQLGAWHRAIADTVVVDASAAIRTNAGHGYALADASVMSDIGETLAGAPAPHASWRTDGFVFALQPGK